MLDLGLFRDRTFTGANLLLLLVALAMFGVFFFLSLYVQNVLGYSPVKAGAAFLPMTALIMFVAPLAGRRSDRRGSRWLLTGGMLLLAAQLLYFSRLGVHEQNWSLVPGMLLGGAGMGAAMAPATAAGPQGRARRQGRRRVGGPELLAPAGRLGRHRAHGRDHGPRDRRAA